MEPTKKSFFRRFWWIGLIILVLIGGLMILKQIKPVSVENQGGPNDSSQAKNKFDKFQSFPVKLEDFVVPSEAYGLWPYGVKGNNSQSHNEGHPGWDFELKKGSKVYAIADLEIKQIHDGDSESGGEPLQVIEAYAQMNEEMYHIVYHSVKNLETGVKEGAVIKNGEPLAEAGGVIGEAVMIHFGIFPPGDSVGSCPERYFADSLKNTISEILAFSLDSATKKPYESACVGKISRPIYEQNYPDKIKYLGGNEEWE